MSNCIVKYQEEVIDFLEKVGKDNRKSYNKLLVKILKLEREKEGAIDGDTIKIIKREKGGKIIEIKLFTKPYRVFTALIDNNSYQLYGYKKKKGRIKNSIIKLVIERTKCLISFINNQK